MTETTAAAHAENALQEMRRKIEEGDSLDNAYIVALDYLEDFAESKAHYRAATLIFRDHPMAQAGADAL